MDSAESVREMRYRWEPIGEDPPEGWRRCDNAQFSEDGMTYSVTYTDAPKNEFPFRFNTMWRKYRRITQVRDVTPWVDLKLEHAHIDGWAHAPQCEESDQRPEAVAFPLTKQEATLLTQALEFYLGSALGPRPAHEDLRGRLATLIDGSREGRTMAIESMPHRADPQ